MKVYSKVQKVVVKHSDMKLASSLIGFLINKSFNKVLGNCWQIKLYYPKSINFRDFKNEKLAIKN